MTPVDVLVAVVSWNTRDLLDDCLRALQSDAEVGRARVVVVDNGSSDGSPEMVATEHPWADLLALDANIGFGRAVNLAARLNPEFRFIAVANADIAVEPASLERLLSAADAFSAAGALAPRLVRPDGATQHSVYRFPSVPFSVAFNLAVHRVVPRLGDLWCLETYWNPDRPRYVPWAIAAFLLVRREAWDAAGGFDERQWMYAEDLDLGWRLDRAGWRTRYVPEARVRHADGAAVRQAFGTDRVARWQRETYAWMRRRQGRVRTSIVAAVNVLGARAKASVLGRLGGRRAEEAEEMRFWAHVHALGLRDKRLEAADRPTPATAEARPTGTESP